jgi:hypothetical protein
MFKQLILWLSLYSTPQIVWTNTTFSRKPKSDYIFHDNQILGNKLSNIHRFLSVSLMIVCNTTLLIKKLPDKAFKGRYVKLVGWVGALRKPSFGGFEMLGLSTQPTGYGLISSTNRKVIFNRILNKKPPHRNVRIDHPAR